MPQSAVTSVVHLITDLDVGGAERMLLRLVTAREQGDSVHTVVSLTDGGRLRPQIEEAGVAVYSLGFRRGLPSLSGLIRLVQLLRSIRPAILQTWLYHADLLGLAASLTVHPRPALAWNLRCSDMQLEQYPRLTRVLVRILALTSGKPDVVLSNSEAGQRWHEKLGYRPKAWALIPNGIDVATYTPDPVARARIRNALGVDDDTVVIGMVARRDPMKDHEGFLRAAASVATAGPKTAFVLIGRGVDGDPDLKALAEKVAAPVHLMAESTSIRDWYVSFDIAVLASNFGEGFPNVIAEAMACGVPAVVTAVGDSATIVADTGRVVAPGDTQALARAVGELAANRQLRQRLGQAAQRRIAENYSLHSVVNRYRDLYGRLAKRAL